ncbi:CHAD domain-containing protein [uncultured Marinobacter sp.]|uniref:CHAD domain-containing protein n=1 Tax=uncultured Marinobacter sp. TaxID=187379 RepID=UPI0030DB93EF
MRYRLRPDGSFSKHLKRLMRSINEEIVLALLCACRDPERGVHEARKNCKEIRALLRLIRPQIGKTEFRFRQAFYQSVANQLSGNRDAVVREKTWQNLVTEVPTMQSPGYEIVAQFLSTQDKLDPEDENGRDFLLELAREVESEIDAPRQWNLPETLPDLIPNLKRIYQTARDAERKANTSDDIEEFHRFRKRTKDLFYCMRVLRPMFGKGLKSSVDDLEALTELQGIANDHAVLLAYLDQHRQAVDLDNARWEIVRGSILEKLGALQKQSHKMARKTLAQSADSFVKAL